MCPSLGSGPSKGYFSSTQHKTRPAEVRRKEEPSFFEIWIDETGSWRDLQSTELYGHPRAQSYRRPLKKSYGSSQNNGTRSVDRGDLNGVESTESLSGQGTQGNGSAQYMETSSVDKGSVTKAMSAELFRIQQKQGAGFVREIESRSMDGEDMIRAVEPPDRFSLSTVSLKSPDFDNAMSDPSSEAAKRRFDMDSHAFPAETLRKIVLSASPSFSPTTQDLHDIFTNVDLLDQPSLITAAQWLIVHLKESTPVLSTAIAAACLKGMFDRHMLVATEPILEAYLKALDRTLAKGEFTAAEIGPWFLAIIQALSTVNTNEQTSLGQAMIRAQVGRLLIHLTVKLDELPRQKFYRNPIDPAILDLALGSRLVSPQVRELVVARAPKSRQLLSSRQQEQCFRSTIQQQDAEVVKEYMDVMRDAFAKTTLREESPSKRTIWTERSALTKDPGDIVDGRGTSVTDNDDVTMHRAEVLLARKSQDLERLDILLADNLQPPSDPQAADDAVQRHQSAWSLLLHGMGASSDVTVREILAIRELMPESAFCAITIAPMIQALAARGAHRKAWNVWAHHVEYAARSKRTNLIDAVLLAIVTQTAAKIMSFPAQLALVDYWAHRPRSIGENGAEGSIKIDAYNVNALLANCRTRRHPSVSLRLWAAAEPRWGVKLDSAALTILLDTCRFFESTRGPESRTMREEIQMFFAQLSHQRLFHSVHDDIVPEHPRYAEYEADGWSKGSARVLLDPQGFKWHLENGAVKPWQIARSIFRQVVLGNWPDLRKVKSPLAAQQKSSEGTFLSRYFAVTQRQEPFSIADKLPLPNAKYMHIIPSAHAFQAYISILGYFGRTEQISEVFAWMRALKKKPTWYSMCVGMAYIKEVQGELRKTYSDVGTGAKWATEEQIMRDYFVSWLGSGSEVAQDVIGVRVAEWKEVYDGRGADGTRSVVPTPADVVALRTWYMGQSVPFRARETGR